MQRYLDILEQYRKEIGVEYHTFDFGLIKSQENGTGLWVNIYGYFNYYIEFKPIEGSHAFVYVLTYMDTDGEECDVWLNFELEDLFQKLFGIIKSFDLTD